MMLRLSALSKTPLNSEPYPYQIIPNFLSEQDLEDAIADFPKLDMGGVFLPEALKYGPKFAQLLKELQGPEFRKTLGDKFGVDLTHSALMTTVRGCSRAKDGRIHTDSRFKVISVLLYLNNDWSSEGGRLRVLNSAEDINDFAAEVSPNGGSLISFRVTPDGWHGHKPFVGVRRNIMLNYCTDERLWKSETKRHRLSGRFKRFKRMLGFGKVPGVSV